MTLTPRLWSVSARDTPLSLRHSDSGKTQARPCASGALLVSVRIVVNNGRIRLRDTTEDLN